MVWICYRKGVFVPQGIRDHAFASSFLNKYKMCTATAVTREISMRKVSSRLTLTRGKIPVQERPV